MKTALLLLLLCARAMADGNAGFIDSAPQRLEIDDCPALPALTQAQLSDLGKERYLRGSQLYTQGDYGGAVTELVLAYCTYPYYLLLKDIGQAYERQLEYDKAIGYLLRYTAGVPKDAKKPEPCSPDPQIDKENVLRRIDVLRHLPGHVLVEADTKGPNGERARVEIATPTVTASTGLVGEQLSVERGHYTLTVQLDGYEPYTDQIDVEIGKPYTFFAKLVPLKGHLNIIAIPADARIFLDDKFVGIGHFSQDEPAKNYEISVEAPNFTTDKRKVAVLPKKVLRETIELSPEPQTGRIQAITYATLGGGLAGAGLFEAGDNNIAAGIGLLAGAGGGFLASVFLLPQDLPLGTSSLSITESVFGAVLGGAAAALFSDKTEHIAPFAGIGAIGGAVIGYVVGTRTRARPGEAAVMNSAQLWGTAFGSLFAVTFDPSTKSSAALVLSGLGMGTVGGLLVTKYFTVSRTHAALVDVGGIIGAIGGVALEGILYPQQRLQTQTNLDTETRARIANFALAGMGVGLILSGVITRNFDSPAIPFQPAMGAATAMNGSATTTFGIRASF